MSAGFPAEATSFLTNAPAFTYDVKGALNADGLWNIVAPADD